MVATGPLLPAPDRWARPASSRPPALADVVLGLARSVPAWVHRLGEHPSRRSGLRLLATHDYDAWLLRWPADTGVTPHDHGGSTGAFTVVNGRLTERRWRSGRQEDRRVLPGDVVTVGRRVVHDVFSAGPDPAVSVHAYSPPLSSMGFYDESGTRLLDRQMVEAEGEPSATVPILNPSAGPVTWRP